MRHEQFSVVTVNQYKYEDMSHVSSSVSCCNVQSEIVFFSTEWDGVMTEQPVLGGWIHDDVQDGCMKQRSWKSCLLWQRDRRWIITECSVDGDRGVQAETVVGLIICVLIWIGRENWLIKLFIQTGKYLYILMSNYRLKLISM